MTSTLRRSNSAANSLMRSGHFRRSQEYQIAALALRPWSQAANVRFGSKADVMPLNFDVRFTPESGLASITMSALGQ
jgi:hypothetical protein